MGTALVLALFSPSLSCVLFSSQCLGTVNNKEMYQLLGMNLSLRNLVLWSLKCNPDYAMDRFSMTKTFTSRGYMELRGR